MKKLRLTNFKSHDVDYEKDVEKVSNLLSESEREANYCTGCDAEFEEQPTLDTHIQLFHEVRFECDVCSYKSSTKNGLSIHKGLKHKDARKCRNSN